MTDMTYARYLALDDLLACQHPQSELDDEMLFIIIHQTKELWLKQIIREMKLAKVQVQADALIPAYKALARVSRIQAVMTLSWDVLSTMTPSDYTRFRHVLGPSSGFQSDQFRTVEYMLGLKDGGFLKYQEDRPEAQQAMRDALQTPSIWDDALAAASRAGLPIPAEVLNRDFSQPYVAHTEVEDAFLTVYREPERYWELYQLAEKLVDLDDAMATWRHKHVITVERVIGGKRGTGGTAGVSYLQATLAKRAFPELWSLRTML
ncbi:MAG TPA: tryptophan 2,3-dioxygenase [Sphingorhabdus sp.]|jgi:tryptophan 2,3-dioxygenase|uniref:tryptophan 2,3-dioxygenase n=1 Tax=Sphingorhabdus sp. TaxID=1902408 RepID=UPI002CE891FF|nr:tryptophan 2,3-dioxygenase [Sphingorhabdus sp.]HMT40057.1 tryptophan 2,3-dioxygenase [Sphingorhabdus sp.]HMU23084.1 tryptophan 2,3-dioxygenase [Sphingorhabdus sp.]